MSLSSDSAPVVVRKGGKVVRRRKFDARPQFNRCVRRDGGVRHGRRSAHPCCMCTGRPVSVIWARMSEPTREEVDAFTEPTVLEFGTTWCGYCQAAQADIAGVMKSHPTVRHLKIEDGKGRPLGRTFRVKLWPTLV